MQGSNQWCGQGFVWELVKNAHMSLSKSTCIGPFLRNDSLRLGDTMLMYAEGEKPWIERECMRVGDVGQYIVTLDTGKILCCEWDRHESHAKFMNDVIIAKNNDEIGSMLTDEIDVMVFTTFKNARTLGDHTGVINVVFCLWD
jgi:hypothetical protein